MLKRFSAMGLMLVISIAGTAWARQPTAAAPVTSRSTSSDSAAETFIVETSTGKIPRPKGSADSSDVNTGDHARNQLPTDSLMANRIDVFSGAPRKEPTVSANTHTWSKTVTPRRLMGLWLLAMTGTAVVRRGRRPGAFRGSRA
jgi:hypothetical protein